ncbi:15872_t:CDS:2, partial [Gigaspora margarita]
LVPEKIKDYWEKIILERKEVGESSTKGFRERKLVNYYKSPTEMDSSDSEKSTNSVNDIDNDSKISKKQIAHFDHIFHDLDPEKIWTLKSGHVVEKPFLPTNTSYFNFDLNYVNLVYCVIHTLWEDDDDFTLDPSRLEEDQKTIGKKRDETLFNDSCDVDGIFKLKSDKLEFGAIEAGRK